jgi:hypothetical protein
MLTFEKVLEIFADYLTADETIEVYISRHGCVRVEFDQDFHYCSGEVCACPFPSMLSRVSSSTRRAFLLLSSSS